MNSFGKFEISASPMKSESQRNTSSDLNASALKSETQSNISSYCDSMSLPCHLYECKCKVVVIHDLLKCGVVELEGTNRKAYCLFFGKDFLSRKELDQKLSTQIPVGSVLRTNAKLIKEKSAIPFLATAVWSEGAIREENELYKLFSNLESRQIEQYNLLCRDLEGFLPRNYQSESRNISPRYRHSPKRIDSTGHRSRIKSRSRSPTYHCSQASNKPRSRSPRDYRGRTKRKNLRYCDSPEKEKRESSITGKRKQGQRELLGEKKIKNEVEDKVIKPEGAEEFCPFRIRSRSPRHYNGRIESKRYCHGLEQDRKESSSIKYKRKQDLREFSDEDRIKIKIENMEVIKSEGSERSHPIGTRSRSPSRYSCRTESKNSRYRHGQEGEGGKSSIKYRRQEESEFSGEKKIKIENENMGGIKTEATEISYKQQLKKCEYQSQETLKLKRENEESKFGNAIKGFNKKTAKMPKLTMRTYQPLSRRGAIFNGKGKILRILNSNYGIAIVFGLGRLCRVLFDIFDVWINFQVCANLGKTLYDVMKEGDLVCLHAVCVEPPISATDNRLRFVATAVAKANSVEGLLNMRLPSRVSPPSVEVVNPDKIKNFHQVAKVVLATQEDDESFKNGIPVGIGILWRKGVIGPNVDFYCFHCKLFGHDRIPRKKFKNLGKSWEAHNEHVLTCKDLKCTERGKWSFERMIERKKIKVTTKQSVKEKRVNQNTATEEQVLQAEEFKRLKKLGNAGKSKSNKLHCFHCQYEGASMSHFTSTEHKDHIKDCGTKILDCPENPEISSAVQKLICWREMLTLPKENHEYHLYHRYFCLHCKEPFSDKRHVRGVNHMLHMAKGSCDSTCKFGLFDDKKYASRCKKGDKSIHQSRIGGNRHSRNVFNLFRKKEPTDCS